MEDCVNIEVSKLKPYEKNARKHSKEQIKMLVNSIKEFGFTNPFIIDENNVILCGNGRYEAVLELGLKQVPCRIKKGLSQEQKQAYVIVDNRMFDLGEWDYEILNTELANIDNIDMGQFGFEDFLPEYNIVNSCEQNIDNMGEEISLDSFEDEKFDYECPYCHFKFNKRESK